MAVLSYSRRTERKGVKKGKIWGTIEIRRLWSSRRGMLMHIRFYSQAERRKEAGRWLKAVLDCRRRHHIVREPEATMATRWRKRNMAEVVAGFLLPSYDTASASGSRRRSRRIGSSPPDEQRSRWVLRSRTPESPHVEARRGKGVGGSDARCGKGGWLVGSHGECGTAQWGRVRVPLRCSSNRKGIIICTGNGPRKHSKQNVFIMLSHNERRTRSLVAP
jgi:hypothetical protein